MFLGHRAPTPTAVHAELDPVFDAQAVDTLATPTGVDVAEIPEALHRTAFASPNSIGVPSHNAVSETSSTQVSDV